MQYLRQPWATIDVDLAPSMPGDLTDIVAISNPELPLVSEARTMRTQFLMAQKIHAALTPDTPDYQFGYARYVVDVLFLAMTGVNINEVRAACDVVFGLRSERDGRLWPPEGAALPECGWLPRSAEIRRCGKVDSDTCS